MVDKAEKDDLDTTVSRSSFDDKESTVTGKLQNTEVLIHGIEDRIDKIDIGRRSNALPPLQRKTSKLHWNDRQWNETMSSQPPVKAPVKQKLRKSYSQSEIQYQEPIRRPGTLSYNQSDIYGDQNDSRQRASSFNQNYYNYPVNNIPRYSRDDNRDIHNHERYRDFDRLCADLLKKREEEKLFTKSRTSAPHEDKIPTKRIERPKSAYYGKRRTNPGFSDDVQDSKNLTSCASIHQT